MDDLKNAAFDLADILSGTQCPRCHAAPGHHTAGCTLIPPLLVIAMHHVRAMKSELEKAVRPIDDTPIGSL